MENIKSKKSNYLFIIESNNDLDMIAPIIWKFSKDIALEMACNIPGHYESGMVGKIITK